MKAAIFNGTKNVSVGERPDPKIQEPTDVLVRVVRACVCGSDLWPYRGIRKRTDQGPIGHEFIGVVTAIGSEVKNLSKGDFVIAPFLISDGTCPHCRAGNTANCAHGSGWARGGTDGGQGEQVRVSLADGTLVKVPADAELTDELLASLTALSDVMPTGHHAAVCARVQPGSTVAVVGDGAVGLCAIIAAKRLGAKRIIALSRNPARQKLAREFGATDIVEERGDDAVK